MTLKDDLNQLQTEITTIIEQSGIRCMSILFSQRSRDAGFDNLSISWSPLFSEKGSDGKSNISQDIFVKKLNQIILDTGLKPFHYSLTIQIENMESIDLKTWKIKTINRNYLKTHSKINGVICEIQFLSMRQ